MGRRRNWMRMSRNHPYRRNSFQGRRLPTPHTDYISDWTDQSCLINLCEKEPDEITLALQFELETVKREITNCVKHKDLHLATIWLRLISKTMMCKSMPSHLQAIFTVVTDEGLAEFTVNEFLTNDDPKVIQYIQGSLENLISICTRAFELFQDRVSILLGLYELLLTLVSSFHSKRGSCYLNIRTEEIYRTFTCLTEIKCSVLRKWIKPCSIGESTDNNSSEDNKHFTDISIVPKPHRATVLAKRSVNLKGNIINGQYDSVDQYLDIHFRLLREEFMSPLREGLQQYLDSISANDKWQRNPHIRVYKDVCITAPVFKKELMFTISFKLTSWMKRINWSYSKRLLHGALVCLSSDNFKTMHFATVTDRGASLLKRGITRVRFEQGLKSINWLVEKRYIMIETSGLFEAYRHVLRALQSLKHTLPFENYILKCRPHVAKPRYLCDKAEVKFNLTPLLEKNVCIVDNKLGIFNDSDHNFVRERILLDLRPSARNSSTHFARNVDIMDYKSWPSYELLKLDESQFRALRTSLTKELSIIQGPPGTGKSFIGLQIVKILLKNQHVWQWREEKVTNRSDLNMLEPKHTSVHSPTNHGMFANNTGSAVKVSEQSIATDNVSNTEDGQIQTTNDLLRDEKDTSDIDTHSRTIHDPRPMLIVCYTNHALDQFLEGILQFYKGDVLRLGSRSKSSLLEKHNLSSVKRNIKLSGALRDSIRKARHETFKLKRCVEYKAIETDILRRNIIHLQSLLDLSFSSLLKQLEENYHRWTIHDEYYYRQQGHTEILMPSITVVWLDLFRKLNEIVTEHKNCKQMSVHKDKNVQAHHINTNEPNKLYDITTVEPEIVHDIRSGLLEQKAAYSPENGHGYKHRIPDEFANYIKAQLRSTDMMTDEEVDYFSGNICALPLDQRWRMYRKFVDNRQKAAEHDAKEDLIKLEKANAKLTELELQKDKEVMKNATIIGMTTTCAAKYHVVLNEVKPRIIIIEEAAEVLESHIISCLNPYCEQMILIGDHKQLRPKVETYDLVNRYHLDVSLFERMVKNGIHYDCLQRQHRMRPEIADVIRHIYPNLDDDEAVEGYPNIGGIAHNLFCVSHSFAETHDEEQKSFSNEHEAKFAVSLANYIMQQGYDASRITVLTTYKGQLFLLKRLLQDDNMSHSNLTVSVVDNYQGEENDIVILSLVRSNENGTIGFLKKANRICVALSRAKMGLYIIGDIEKLAQSSELWNNILSDLRLKNLIGSSLPLYCQNHKTETVYASTCKDFNKVPDGGCDKPCEWRLDCGHVCERKCHVIDSNHDGTICTKPCIRLCKNGHRCRERCNVNCGDCSETILKTLECGHMNKIPCYRDDDDSYICEAVCNKQLNCGHICTKPCSERCSPCENTYKASLLRCKHEVDIVCSVLEIPQCKLPCSQSLDCGHDCIEACKNIHTDPTKENDMSCALGHKAVCQNRCETVLACQHRCNGTCYSCFGKRLHARCLKRCNCDLACGHGCEGMCGECFPCERYCENACPHGLCMKRCKEPCQKCDEPCEWKCAHFKCTRPCGEICNRPRCDQHCKKLLKCGHLCIGLCGEPCPKKCLICDKNFLRSIRISGIENDAPCVVQLDECQHIFEYRQMDNYMDEKEEVIRLKRCPVCAEPIRRSRRYSNIVKEILRKIEMLKEDAVKAAQEDDSLSTNIGLNVKNTVICLEEIDDHFRMGDLNDSPFLETVVLKNSKLLNTMTLPSKQFVSDISLEIRRCFDIAFLNMLKTRLNLADASLGFSACIKTTMSQIQQKKRYDVDIQNVVKEIIEKIRGECQGVRPAMLEIKVVEIDPAAGEVVEIDPAAGEVVEIDPAAGEDHKDESTAAENTLDNQQVHTEVSQQEVLKETTTEEPRIFQLQLYIKKELPYYNCGKSQIDQSRGQSCTVAQNGNHEISRKGWCSNQLRDLQDGEHVKQPVSLKRAHTGNDDNDNRSKVKKLTESANKVSERLFTPSIDKCTDERPEKNLRKRKQTEPNDVLEKTLRIAEENGDNDDQGVLEALLKRDEDADAVVEILDDCNDSACIEQHSTHKKERRRQDFRDWERNSRKSSPHSKSSKRNTNKDNNKSTDFRRIKQHRTHEAHRRQQDSGDRETHSKSKTSTRNDTNKDNMKSTDSRHINTHETQSRKQDRRDQGRNSRKPSHHSKSKTSTRIDTIRANMKSTDSRHINTHETQSKKQDGRDRGRNSRKPSHHSNTSKRDRTNQGNIILTDSRSSDSCLREIDLRKKLKKQGNRPSNERFEESVATDQYGSLLKTTVTDFSTELNTTDSKSIDCRQIIDERRKSRQQKSSSEGVRVDDSGTYMDDTDTSIFAYSMPPAAGNLGLEKPLKQYGNGGKRRVNLNQTGDPSKAPVTDLRMDMNNTETKVADFRQIIDKRTRKSKGHDCSPEGTELNETGHHKDGAKVSYSTNSAAKIWDIENSSKQYGCSDTRRVDSVKSHTYIDRDIGNNDHVSKVKENERAVVTYDDLFDN